MNNISRVEGGWQFGVPRRRLTPTGSRNSGIV
jgi:hypothetical protein